MICLFGFANKNPVLKSRVFIRGPRGEYSPKKPAENAGKVVKCT